MEYLSTRDRTLRLTAAQAIKMGLSRDGGLFTPVEIPGLSPLELERKISCSSNCLTKWLTYGLVSVILHW